jgi:hypothetical protein
MLIVGTYGDVKIAMGILKKLPIDRAKPQIQVKTIEDKLEENGN